MSLLMMAEICGSVLAVNIGQARPMIVQGESIVTGFDKRPASGAVRVGPDGLAGDDHVDDALDRDRAVLLYQRGHYDLWERELGRRLPPGTFGENLTIAWPPDEEVILGDELRVGDARLRVTQPRIPCRKMAVRLGEGAGFPGRYLRSGRLGFFCAVVRPGHVRPGDRIELVRRGTGGMSMAELARTLHGEPSPDALRRVLACGALPATLRAKAAKLLERAAGGEAWPGERTLVVTARRREAAGVVSFDLADRDGARLPEFQAGQFLTLVLDVPGAGRPVVRPYTIVGRSEEGGYRIAVKREPAPPGAVGIPAGLASTYLHAQMPVGARVRARAPRGRFVLAPGWRPVVLVSAGIGITPMLAMLERLATDEYGREVFLAHGARSSRQFAFGSQIHRIIASNTLLHSHVMFSRPEREDVQGEAFDEIGRLTPAVLKRLLPSLDADFYVCGPGGFMQDMIDGLVERGVPRDRVRFEFFGAVRSPLRDGGAQAGAAVVDAHGRPILVTFVRSGLAVRWREDTFSLLALAERAGLRPDASCRSGLCGACMCRIDDGEVEYAVAPVNGVPPNQVLVCCTRPTTSVMLDM
ncbi:MOSC domain-containing protein [[Actinomadura] parvosata]|uniref:MOSC domain-containing protein n=1 Tax=[Actinomadura] parvosata TaxID=1955412 RepID=UPI00406C1288